MFIYSCKWQESQVFHRYVQRDINSSHFLHKVHSAGTVQGTQGAWGQRGHILYTELKHTCFTPYRKRTEPWRGNRGEGSRREGEERIRRQGGWIFTHIQIQKNMYKSYSLQALCAHIYSHRNRQRNHSMAGLSIWDLQVQGLTVEKQSQLWGLRLKPMESERQGIVATGRQGGPPRHMRGVLQPGELVTVENYIIRFYLSERTLKLSVRALPSSLYTFTALGHSYLACGQNLYELHNAS